MTTRREFLAQLAVAAGVLAVVKRAANPGVLLEGSRTSTHLHSIEIGAPWDGVNRHRPFLIDWHANGRRSGDGIGGGFVQGVNPAILTSYRARLGMHSMADMRGSI